MTNWISVKDKHPALKPDMHGVNSSQDVLVMVMNPDGSWYTSVGKYRDIFGGIWYVYRINGYMWDRDRVVKWRPLL